MTEKVGFIRVEIGRGGVVDMYKVHNDDAKYMVD